MSQLVLRNSVFMATLLCASTPVAFSYEMQHNIVNYQISSGRVITVSGTGSRHISPDQAHLRLASKNFDEKPQLAYEQNTATCKKVLAVLAEFQIAPQDIQTSEISVDSIYPADGQNRYSLDPTAKKPLGYRVERSIEILIKDLKIIPNLVSRSVAAGATDISALLYDTTRMRAMKDEARLMALRAAKEKAEAMARELNYKLGKALSISEVGSEVKDMSTNQTSMAQYNDTYAGISPGEETNTGFEPGQIVVSSSISITFEVVE